MGWDKLVNIFQSKWIIFEAMRHTDISKESCDDYVSVIDTLVCQCPINVAYHCCSLWSLNLSPVQCSVQVYTMPDNHLYPGTGGRSPGQVPTNVWAVRPGCQLRSGATGVRTRHCAPWLEISWRNRQRAAQRILSVTYRINRGRWGRPLSRRG